MLSFENIIDYTFKNQSLLTQALTHKSAAFEKGMTEAHNERLEFLGDAVLDLIIATKLMKDLSANEGELSRRRAALVNERTLSQIARQMGLSQYLILGKGESQSNGTGKDSILASTLEAVFGAVYLDGGLEASEKIIEKHFTKVIVEDLTRICETDYKTKLQEKWQAFNRTAPLYKLDRAEGPDHQKTFFVSVFVGDKKLSEGIGKSRKEAEQKAAENALKSEINL